MGGGGGVDREEGGGEDERREWEAEKDQQKDYTLEYNGQATSFKSASVRGCGFNTPDCRQPMWTLSTTSVIVHRSGGQSADYRCLGNVMETGQPT